MLIVSASVMLLISSFTSLSPVSAAETPTVDQVKVNDQMKVYKNEKYEALEKELAEMQNNKISTFRVGNNPSLTEKEFLYLSEKYDGAEMTVIVQNAVYYQEKFINGGGNYYASSRGGMSQLRSDLATTAVGLRASGTLSGLALGGPLGAFIGFLGSDVLANRISDGSDIMRQWINAGRNQGGVRITLTEAFAIAGINSTVQTPIK